MRDSSLRYVIFPILNLATGCLRRYRFLSDLQWNRQTLGEWQEHRLSQLVAHAYSSVPFYRKRLKEAGLSPSDVQCLGDLSKLPITSKHDLGAFPKELVSTAVTSRRRRLTNTSGTGQMLEFYDDTNVRGFVVASRLLFESWMGLAVGDRTVRLTNWPSTWRNRVIGELRVQVSRLEGDAHEAIEVVKALHPSSLIGTVSILSSFSNNILRSGVEARMDLRGIATSADMLLPSHRDMIAKAFESPVFDRYGLAEMSGYVAQECDTHQGLHVNEGLVIAEVVKDGQLCGPGETGRLILTNLHNYVMPFIRYDTGDIATVGDECSCGRSFAVLARIEGRSPGWVITKSIPIAWTSFLVQLQSMNFAKIEQFQFVQKKVGELTLLIAPRSALVNSEITQLTRHMNSIRSLVTVKVEIVDSIEPAASGKHILFKPLNVSNDSREGEIPSENSPSENP